MRAATRCTPNTSRATRADRMLELSPLLTAAKASARSVPAWVRTARSKPMPVILSPLKDERSLRNASGSLSMTAMLLPRSSRMWAIVDPTRPQPMITMCTTVPPAEPGSPIRGASPKVCPYVQEFDPMNYQTGQVVEVTAGDVAHGGWCVARPADGPVVFVRHALPGERVLARVTEVTTRLARAEAVEILAASPDRVEAPCPHAHPGGCGGCDWQHAALPAQRSLKAAVIRQQLRRLAGVDREVTVEPLPGDEDVSMTTATGPAGSVESTGSMGPGGPGGPGGSTGLGLGWRTRVQFAVRQDGVAGLRAHRSHDVVDVGRCLIAHPAITDLGLLARRWPGTASVEALVAVGSGERAVIITPGGSRPATRPSTRSRAGRPAPAAGSEAGRSASIEGITADSVLRRGGTPTSGLTPLRGRSYLSQHAAGRDWRVSAGAFWQVHPAAADVLTDAVMTGLKPGSGDTALDL